ncbi:MAG: formylglycine-generating enzyme family protein [Nitrospirae bacterium]|nr:formylglycine-generating enzyme family protein [Nitrospirota bacterium]
MSRWVDELMGERVKECMSRRIKTCFSLIFSFTLLLIYSLTLLLFYNADAAEVKNVVPRQEGNRVLFEFDVAGDADEEAEVDLTLTINGQTYTADKLHLEGDFGKVKTGKGRKIYWNVLQDFPRGLSTAYDWEIAAGGEEFKDPVTGMEFVFVKGGCYQMGCGDWTSDCDSDEKPVHEVCVDDFYMGKYEVTQRQWKEIMGNNPSYFKNCGDDCPVENVSWDDVQEYIKKMNQKITPHSPPLSKGGNKGGYRLPTEAEWEYSARSGGKKEKYSGGDDVGSVAWYDSNSGSTTHPAGQKKPNGLGLYDMSGNVWEWVDDWYGEDYYMNSPKNNPKGPSSGSYRVLRGGSWYDDPRGMRSANRYRANPGGRDGSVGFRLLRTK